MTRFRLIQHWWRRNIECDATLRAIFYQLLEAQSRSGSSLLNACKALANQSQLHKVLRELGRCGAAALAAGHLASEGWRDSGYLPLADCGVIGIAEQSGTILDAMARLADPARRVPTFSNAVLRPNIGQLLPFSIALAMTVASPGVLERIAADQELLRSVPLYLVATWLQLYGMPVMLALVCTAVTVAYGRSRWVGSKRRLLAGFGRDWFAQSAIRFCRLAAALTREGATHRQTLTAFREIALSKYAQHVIPLVERDVLDGRTYAASLADRLLPAALAGLLDAFSPGDDRARYPTAFDSLADIQDALLRGTYTVWARSLTVLLMCVSASLILLLIHGLLDVARNLTQQIGMGF